MKSKYGFTIIIFILLMTGCTQNPLAPVILQLSGSWDIYPMTVGNTWTYTCISSGGGTYDSISRITGRRVVDGLECYVFEDESGITGYSFKDHAGIWEYVEGSLSKNRSEHIYLTIPGWNKKFILPFVEGNNWYTYYDYNETFNSGTPEEFKVVSKSNSHYEVLERETAVVPAGMFEDCFRIRATVNYEYHVTYPQKPTQNMHATGTYMTTFWFSEGVGIVKERYDSETGWNEEQLKGYHIN